MGLDWLNLTWPQAISARHGSAPIWLDMGLDRLDSTWARADSGWHGHGSTWHDIRRVDSAQHRPKLTWLNIALNRFGWTCSGRLNSISAWNRLEPTQLDMAQVLTWLDIGPNRLGWTSAGLTRLHIGSGWLS